MKLSLLPAQKLKCSARRALSIFETKIAILDRSVKFIRKMFIFDNFRQVLLFLGIQTRYYIFSLTVIHSAVRTLIMTFYIEI